MRTAGRIYDFTLTAGGSMQLLVQGDYMRIMSSTGAVEVLTDNYRIGPIMAGQGQAKSPFTRLSIIDRSGAANVGYVLVADSDFIDNRINGEVSVIDGEKARTLAGGMFAGAGIQAALAANVSAIQLWNPAASGKNIIVSTLSMGSSVGSGAQVYTGSTMYVTDITAARAGNKLAGGVAGSAQLRADYAAAPPAYANNLLRSVNILANTEFVWNVRGAIVVPPGKSINVIGTVVNAQLVSNFEWFEELV